MFSKLQKIINMKIWILDDPVNEQFYYKGIVRCLLNECLFIYTTICIQIIDHLISTVLTYGHIFGSPCWYLYSSNRFSWFVYQHKYKCNSFSIISFRLKRVCCFNNYWINSMVVTLYLRVRFLWDTSVNWYC
jgi:hypothetical protein